MSVEFLEIIFHAKQSQKVSANTETLALCQSITMAFIDFEHRIIITAIDMSRATTLHLTMCTLVTVELCNYVHSQFCT